MSAKRDDYRETTEEDLQNIPPMSKTQKVILVIAGAAVLFAIGYYVVRFVL